MAEPKPPPGPLYRLGDFLFRHRSYTPIPLAAVLIWQAEVRYPLLLLGLIMMAGGELLRLSAVRAFGQGRFRTRRVGAQELVTWGLYAHIRNPWYMGNLFLWTGAAVFAGGPYLLWLIGVVLIFFLVQYSLIVLVEERTLAELFGDDYTDYCQSVPRIVPRFRRAVRAEDAPQEARERAPRSWWRAARHERSTLTAIMIVIILATLSTYLKT